MSSGLSSQAELTCLRILNGSYVQNCDKLAHQPQFTEPIDLVHVDGSSGAASKVADAVRSKSEDPGLQHMGRGADAAGARAGD